MNYGFVRVAAAIPSVRVANCEYNAEHISQLIAKAEEAQAEVVCFPELSITAYTCQDLFASQQLLDKAEIALIHIVEATRSLNVTAIVGMPVSCDGMLLNCAVVVSGGKIVGAVPKNYLPCYREFYEMRWFASAIKLPPITVMLAGQTVTIDRRQIFETPSFKFGIELCEDLWAPEPPSTQLALGGAEVIFNLSASNDLVGKEDYLNSLLAQQSARLHCGYVYSGCGYGESTQDLVFGGKAMIYENGHLLAEAKRFSLDEQLIFTEIDVERLRSERRTNTTFSASVAKAQRPMANVQCSILNGQWSMVNGQLTRPINPHPFVPEGKDLDERCQEIFNIQVHGLAKRIDHVKCDTLVLGVSGGLDSTLALLVSVKACDLLGRPRQSVVGITMPGFGTTTRTYTNATNLMKQLGITIREISIAEACEQHFRDLGYDPAARDITYENAQARERTQILMDAANQMNGLVVGTGDLSELALGWATYNGDHMSMYGVNASVPKTLVRHLVVWTARHMVDDACRAVLEDIAATPISPELLPADEQRTEDLVGPYELHDFFLYYTLRHGFAPRKTEFLARTAFAGKYDDDTIRHWLRTFLRRFFQQQFKRSCMPDGPKVGSCSLSPRGDWRMPSDADPAQWIEELNDQTTKRPND